jgi:hypothetical protein
VNPPHARSVRGGRTVIGDSQALERDRLTCQILQRLRGFYAQLVKQYGTAPEAEKRYSPPVCLGAERHVVRGRHDPDEISTSYVERQNLSMRMGMRRFTRLTNLSAKKVENHMHAISIYFMHNNFVRIHQTLRCTPAMKAKVKDRLWSIEDMVAIVDEWEAAQKGE